MLLRQPLVRSQQDDVIRRLVLRVERILEDIDIHEERLARAGRFPEGNLVQVLQLGIRQFERRSLALIVDGNLLIQFSQQLGPTVEVPVEIQLRHQKRQPLVVLELIGRVLVLVALLGDLLPVADNPQVVRGQFVLGALRVIAQIEQRVHDGMVEAGMSVLVVEALQVRCLEHRGDGLEAGLVEDSERPPRQHEHPMELGDRDR